MNINYVPSSAKGKSAKFKGSVVLKVPSIIDRYKFMGMAKIKAEGDNLTMQSDTNGQLEYITKMIEQSIPFYVKVDLEYISTQKKYTNFDELAHDPDCDSVVIEIASNLVNGFRLGNQKGQS